METSKPETIQHVTHLRVRYADTDQMGIVYYGKYFEYFEVARTEMLRACGLPYATIEAAGFRLPVADAKAKYLRGAKYDDLLRVTASMNNEPATRLEIRYDVHLEDTSELIAQGETTLVFVSSATGKPSRPPEIYVKALAQHSKK
jgi:acyl-CoA thioester hydrolase